MPLANMTRLDTHAVKYAFEIDIAASSEKIWNLLTHNIATWWPEHFHSSEETKQFTMEPRVGGMIFEDQGDGNGVLWGTILQFDAPAPVMGDAIVVLTGGELRVREGLKLFAEGAGRRILISGVNPATSKEELRRLSGVTPLLFDCCVDIGYVARDTIGNAEDTRTWLRIWDLHRLILVTSNYHMPRSLAEFRRALPGVEIVPHALRSRHYQASEWWRHPGALKLVVTEYLKFLPAAVRLAVNRSRGTVPTLMLPVPPQPEILMSPPRLTGL